MVGEPVGIAGLPFGDVSAYIAPQLGTLSNNVSAVNGPLVTFSTARGSGGAKSLQVAVGNQPHHAWSVGVPGQQGADELVLKSKTGLTKGGGDGAGLGIEGLQHTVEMVIAGEGR